MKQLKRSATGASTQNASKRGTGSKCRGCQIDAIDQTECTQLQSAHSCSRIKEIQDTIPIDLRPSMHRSSQGAAIDAQGSTGSSHRCTGHHSEQQSGHHREQHHLVSVGVLVPRKSKVLQKAETATTGPSLVGPSDLNHNRTESVAAPQSHRVSSCTTIAPIAGTNQLSRLGVCCSAEARSKSERVRGRRAGRSQGARPDTAARGTRGARSRGRRTQ